MDAEGSEKIGSSTKVDFQVNPTKNIVCTTSKPQMGATKLEKRIPHSIKKPEKRGQFVAVYYKIYYQAGITLIPGDYDLQSCYKLCYLFQNSARLKS